MTKKAPGGNEPPVPEKEKDIMKNEAENDVYEEDKDDWIMEDDDPYYGLPGIDPEYEEWLEAIGEDPWDHLTSLFPNSDYTTWGLNWGNIFRKNVDFVYL